MKAVQRQSYDDGYQDGFQSCLDKMNEEFAEHVALEQHAVELERRLLKLRRIETIGVVLGVIVVIGWYAFLVWKA